MPTSTGNPVELTLRTDLPQSGRARSTFTGLQLKEPVLKANLSGSVRRHHAQVAFNAGAAMADGTTYRGWIAIPRPALITGLWLLLETAPTVNPSTLTVTFGGVSLLAAANFSVTAAHPVGTPVALALSVAAAVGANVAPGLPYLTGNPPAGILCTYAEGTATVQTLNALLLAEYEMDDFAG